MTKWQKVVTYVLFMVHADTMAEWRVEWWNGRLAGMVEWQEWQEWREWQNGRKNGRIAEWQKWLHTYYLWYTPTTTLKSFIVQADRAYGTEISPRLFVISFVILLYAISYNICI